MALTAIQCPYCNNVMPVASVATGRQWGFSKLFSYQGSATVTKPSYNVSCSCNRSYKYYQYQNHGWLKSQLYLSDYAIETFNILAEQCGTPFPCDHKLLLDWTFSHVVGVTSPQPDSLHICFDYDNHRFYLDCIWQDRFLSGLNVYMVY